MFPARWLYQRRLRRRIAVRVRVIRGASSSRICSPVSTSLAPWRIRAWQPRASGLWMEPGMANTSRPCSRAARAVIREPERSAASTTRVPRLRPLIMRLRRGKLVGQRGGAGWKLGNQSAVFSNLVGQVAVMCGIHPIQAGTGHCDGAACVRSAPRCAAASIPVASPLVMVSP